MYNCCENCSVVLLCLLAYLTVAFPLMLLRTMHNGPGLMMTEVKKTKLNLIYKFLVGEG